jgi:hypothetical protein
MHQPLKITSGQEQERSLTSMVKPGGLGDEKQGKSSTSGKRKLSSDESSDDDHDEDDDLGSTTEDGAEGGGAVSKVRREKRLAMNRASARARRKRKKVLLDSLATQVTELTRRNQTIQLANDTLRGRVEHLESALGQAQTTIAALLAEARQNAELSQQLGVRADIRAATTSQQQENLRALLQAAASSSLNPGGPGLLGGVGGAAGTVGASTIASRLAQHTNLLNAHLFAQRGGAGQQNRFQLLEAAGFGGAFRLPSNEQGYSAASASPISSFLGLNRVS